MAMACARAIRVLRALLQWFPGIVAGAAAVHSIDLYVFGLVTGWQAVGLLAATCCVRAALEIAVRCPRCWYRLHRVCPTACCPRLLAKDALQDVLRHLSSCMVATSASRVLIPAEWPRYRDCVFYVVFFAIAMGHIVNLWPRQGTAQRARWRR
ncbi:hypothetical protein LCGC14_2953750 [marine sediment metagenome]|uniref:Uncharacterized protein n=1 Tax=marine sediment metagenome TaxID=412755 RepID=A0A0F8ZM49_9ZZZZ